MGSHGLLQWPDTNATRDQRLVPPQRQRDGIRAAEAEQLQQLLAIGCARDVHVGIEVQFQHGVGSEA